MFILHRTQSTQRKITIMFTATFFDSRESSSGSVRTIYKVVQIWPGLFYTRILFTHSQSRSYLNHLLCLQG